MSLHTIGSTFSLPNQPLSLRCQSMSTFSLPNQPLSLRCPSMSTFSNAEFVFRYSKAVLFTGPHTYIKTCSTNSNADTIHGSTLHYNIASHLDGSRSTVLLNDLQNNLFCNIGINSCRSNNHLQSS